MRLPVDCRCEEIKAIVVELFDRLGVSAIPVDPWEIARVMGIVVVPYSKLNAAQIPCAMKMSESGFWFNLRDLNGAVIPYIFYNNVGTSIGHQRFTLLHELGHIVLGHKQESELAEKEANFFAKFAIAPPPLVNVLCPSDYMDIADEFGISASCALNSMEYYIKWIRFGSEQKYESDLVNMFTIVTPQGELLLRKGA